MHLKSLKQSAKIGSKPSGSSCNFNRRSIISSKMPALYKILWLNPWGSEVSFCKVQSSQNEWMIFLITSLSASSSLITINLRRVSAFFFKKKE